jgi:hypothetical protein
VKTHDSLGRRYRHKRVSTGKRVSCTDRDILLLEKIHRHGPLSTSYLLAYSQSLRKNNKRTIERLCDLYNENGTPHGGPYLDRPIQQFEVMDARQNELCYDLTEAGEQILKEQGLWSDYAPAPGGSWKHQYMTSAITASIELATLGTSTRYIFQDEILSKAKTRLAFDTANTTLIPDALFGLEYNEGKKLYRFFVVEADRATEPGRGNVNRKTFERSIDLYRSFIGQGQYKQALGLTAGLLVLTVTTGERRMKNLIEITKEISPNGSNTYMLYQTEPSFGGLFKPPKPLELYTKPWHRAGLPPFFIHTP